MVLLEDPWLAKPYETSPSPQEYYCIPHINRTFQLLNRQTAWEPIERIQEKCDRKKIKLQQRLLPLFSYFHLKEVEEFSQVSLKAGFVFSSVKI